MLIGTKQEFEQGQMSKLERCRKEEKRIKKGIYRMHVMVESECTETFTKENSVRKSRTKDTQGEEGEKKEEQREKKNTDIRIEMEKMLSTVNKNVGGIA